MIFFNLLLLWFIILKIMKEKEEKHKFKLCTFDKTIIVYIHKIKTLKIIYSN